MSLFRVLHESGTRAIWTIKKRRLSPTSRRSLLLGCCPRLMARSPPKSRTKTRMAPCTTTPCFAPCEIGRCSGHAEPPARLRLGCCPWPSPITPPRASSRGGALAGERTLDPAGLSSFRESARSGKFVGVNASRWRSTRVSNPERIRACGKRRSAGNPTSSVERRSLVRQHEEAHASADRGVGFESSYSVRMFGDRRGDAGGQLLNVVTSPGAWWPRA